MANLITVRLNKGDCPSWGFRLQGGKDFGAPLVIQKVNVGSPAERAGLIAGDSVIRVNNTDVFNLRHKDAQDVIVRAGPSFEIILQRGSTWKPTVIPTGSLSSPKPHVPVNNISPVTKTSLTAPKSDNWGSVGTGHNLSAKPFAGVAINGDGPKLVNKQYNSPVNLYSEDTIAETLSAQAEVLANGVLGVNFKKNEKTYDGSKSNVLRYVQEDEQEPKSPEPSAHDTVDSGVVTTPSQLGVAGLRPVRAPENKPAPTNPTLPPGQNICADCERLIVGVFVRIKEKNLHVECFKCSTCGSSLKNVGYYNINGKLYCDVHAKLAARNNPPGGANLAPSTIAPPSGRPIGGVSSLSPNSLPSSAPLSPNVNNYAPPPFQPHDQQSGYICVRSNAPNLVKTSLNSAASRKRYVTNNGASNPIKTNKFSPSIDVSSTNYLNKNLKPGHNIITSRPFSSSSGPLSPGNSYVGNSYSTLPKISTTPLSSDRTASLNVVWPPPPPEESEVPTACPIYLPPPSHVKVKTLEESVAAKRNNSREHSVENCYVKNKENIFEENTNLSSLNYSEVSEYSEVEEMSFVAGNIGQFSSQYSDTSSISGRKSSQECAEYLSEVIGNQKMVQKLINTRPLFIETDETFTSEQPMWEAKSVVKETSNLPVERKMQADEEGCTLQIASKTETASVMSSEFKASSKEEKKEIVSTTTKETPSTCSIKLNRYTKNSVPHEYESPMVLALTVASDKPFSQMQVEITKSEHTKLDDVSEEIKTCEEIVSSSTESEVRTSSQVDSTSKQVCSKMEASHESIDQTFVKIPEKRSSSALASALATAPTEPFGISQISKEAISLPPETKPYFPPSDLFAVKITGKSEEEIKKSEKLSRFRKKKDELEDIFKDLPKPTKKLDFLSALTTAPDRPFSPILSADLESIENNVSAEEDKIITESSKVLEVKKDAKIDECKVESKKKIGECKSETAAKVTFSKANVENEVKQQKAKQVETSDVHTVYIHGKKIDYSTNVDNKEFETELKKDKAQKEKNVKQTPTPVSSQTQKENISKSSKIPKLIPEIKTTECSETCSKSNCQLSANTCQKNVLRENIASNVISSETVAQKTIAVPEVTTSPQYKKILQSNLDDKPPSRTHSPRPRSITPSMINKTPPLIPAYQAMIVPMECLPALSIVYDPSSPGGSRPSSPYPGRISASSGRTSPGLSINPQDHTHSKCAQQSNEDRVQQVKAAKFALEKVSSDVEASRIVNQSKENNVREVSETVKMKQEQERCLKEEMQSKSESVEVKNEGNLQIQRKKKVTEEFEHSQKTKTVQIAQSTLTTKSRVIGGDCQVAVSGMHVTNPQPLRNPFLDKSIAEKSNQSQQDKISNVSIDKKVNIQPEANRNACTIPNACHNIACPTPSNIPKPLLRTKSFPVSGSSPKPFNPPPLSDIVTRPNVSLPNAGTGSGRQIGAVGFSPKRGRGVLNLGGGSRVPLCGHCHKNIRSDTNSQTNPIHVIETVCDRDNEENGQILDHKFKEITITIPYSKHEEAFSLESTSPSGSNCSSLSSGNVNYLKRNASDGSEDSGKPESLHEDTQISSSEDLTSSNADLCLKRNNYNSNFAFNKVMLSIPTNTDDSKNHSSDHGPNTYNHIENLSTESCEGKINKQGSFRHYANAEDNNFQNTSEGVLTSVPVCNQCNQKITRGPFVTALGKIWCPEHFSCSTPSCKRPLQDLGFVEEQGQLYCEYCFERYLAPNCAKCAGKIKAEVLKAIGKHFHPECFTCVYCGKLFGNNPFFIEDGQPYCEHDWNELFTTKCFACGFPIEAGDRWVEALSNNYHSQCFNCTMCKKNLEGQSFFAKGGRPFCKNHAR